MQPMNRLRNSKSCYIANSCSRCSSLQSLSAHGSNSSLAFLNRSVESKPRSFMASVDYEKVHQYIDNSSHHLLDETADFDLIGNFKSKQSSQFKATYEEITCKLCLNDCKEDQITKIKSCGCFFCIEVRSKLLWIFNSVLFWAISKYIVHESICGVWNIRGSLRTVMSWCPVQFPRSRIIWRDIKSSVRSKFSGKASEIST